MEPSKISGGQCASLSLQRPSAQSCCFLKQLCSSSPPATPGYVQHTFYRARIESSRRLLQITGTHSNRGVRKTLWMNPQPESSLNPVLLFILILHHSCSTALLSVVVQSSMDWRSSQHFDKRLFFLSFGPAIVRWWDCWQNLKSKVMAHYSLKKENTNAVKKECIRSSCQSFLHLRIKEFNLWLLIILLMLIFYSYIKKKNKSSLGKCNVPFSLSH